MGGMLLFVISGFICAVFFGALIITHGDTPIPALPMLCSMAFLIFSLLAAYDYGKQSVLENNPQAQKAVLLQEKESLEQRMLELSEELKEFEEEK